MIAADNDTRRGKTFWGPGPVPKDAVLVGTVYRAPGISGALLRLASGQYAQGNAGSVRPVNQASIERALRYEGNFIQTKEE